MVTVGDAIYAWELTICYESNIEKSRDFKKGKYKDLKADLSVSFNNRSLWVDTIEVRSLGFISDTNSFTSKSINQSLPDNIASEISKTVISQSFSIYKKQKL